MFTDRQERDQRAALQPDILKKKLKFQNNLLKCSVADPGKTSRILIFPSRIQGQKGPESGSATKILSD
jgi:hypothetical protein